MSADKIGAQHRARKAVLYVRQSSAHQVQHNRESQILQCAMRERLVQLGWSEIEVIGTIARHNAHPAMLLKRTDFVGQASGNARYLGWVLARRARSRAGVPLRSPRWAMTRGKRNFRFVVDHNGMAHLTNLSHQCRLAKRSELPTPK
jgi:hypothetical protein